MEGAGRLPGTFVSGGGSAGECSCTVCAKYSFGSSETSKQTSLSDLQKASFGWDSQVSLGTIPQQKHLGF